MFADEKQNRQIRGGISKAYQNAELDVSFVDASGKTFKKIQEMPVVGLHVEIQAIPNGLVLDGFLFVNKTGYVFLDFLYIDGGDFCFFQAKQIFECAVLLFGKRLFENVKHEEKWLVILLMVFLFLMQRYANRQSVRIRMTIEMGEVKW